MSDIFILLSIPSRITAMSLTKTSEAVAQAWQLIDDSTASCKLQAWIRKWLHEGFSGGKGRYTGSLCLETPRPRNDFTLLFSSFSQQREGTVIESKSICQMATLEKPIAFEQHTEERCIHSPGKSEPRGDCTLEWAIESGAGFLFNSSLIRSLASNWLSNLSISNQH